MTSCTLNKFALTPVVISAAVFAVFSLPLAMFGSNPVTIQLQEEPMFDGQLRDVAAPYLGLATALSLGAGVASVAVTGWRQSARKSAQVESKLSNLAQNIKEKESQLEALKLDKSHLEAAGLSAFLDQDVIQKSAPETSAVSLATEPVVKPVVITTQPVEAQPMAGHQVTVQGAIAKFASSQGFLGYTQTKTSIKPPTAVTSLAPDEVEQLHTQLQQIQAQMASLQMALSATSLAAKPETQAQVQTSEFASSVPLRVVKS
jgi:hypothetical protein